MNILITGRPGVGKTTLIRELTRSFSGKAGGFYTEEIRKNGARTGFEINTLDGKKGILASVDTDSRHKVGRYKVNVEGFERIVLPAIEQALTTSGTIIIDEIGPMELFSGKFREVVLKAFDSPNQVIATIKLKGSKFTDSLKSRRDVTVYTLTRDNHSDILNNLKRV